MKTSKLIFTLLITFCMSVCLSAQDKQVPNTPVYYSHSTTGDIGNPMLSTVPVQPKEMNPQEKELERQLEEARLSNNVERATKIQSELDRIRGHVQVYQESDPRAEYRLMQESFEGDYVTSQIHNMDIWSNATATVPVGAPNANRIWYATTQWASSGPDTLKLFYSSNGGASWVYYGMTWMNINFDFRKDELDIEVVYDGSTGVWLFITAGYHDYADNRNKCLLTRVNPGGGFYNLILNFPGNVTGNNYYNPRIVSDNSNYTTLPYVMVLCSMDSLYSGSNHALKQKYALSISPFTTVISLDYDQPGGASGFHWSCACGLGSMYLYGDIGYYRDDGGSGSNRVYAVYSNPEGGYNQLWLAWLNGYSTLGGTLVIAESHYNFGARIAFNGGANNRFGMISYVRQFSGNDWDPFCQRTTNGGSTLSDWTAGYINASTNRARYCDIIALRGSVNQFRAIYIQDNPAAPSIFYCGWAGSSWNTPSATVINTLAPDTQFARPRAGYVGGSTDDCLGIWSGSINSTYASRLCMTTVGIHQTGIPLEYSLSQNYPNPFNPATKIKFEIPSNVKRETSNVKMIVYDILGKEIGVLVNEQLKAGSYEIEFDGTNYPSGVYFYRLETNSFSDVKKMVLIK